jgi:two-component system response regulator RegX3
MPATVLIVGNDKTTTASYASFFGKKEYNVLAAHSGRQALAQAKSHRLDAVVVDATSSNLNCKNICRKLRHESFATIVVITSPNTKFDSALADGGIVVKPVVARKLITRVKAAIENKPPRLMTVGRLSLDLEKHRLVRGSKAIALTPKEFALLKVLMTRAGQTVTRKALMKEVWATEYLGDTRTLDVHVRWTREKLEENPSKPKHLTTVRGQGYKFVVN